MRLAAEGWLVCFNDPRSQSLETCKNSSSESRKEATDRMMEVLSAKTKTGIGFWNVCTMYETGKLAQVPAEMRRYKLHILGGEPEKVDCIGRGGGGRRRQLEKQCSIRGAKTTNTKRELP